MDNINIEIRRAACVGDLGKMIYLIDEEGGDFQAFDNHALQCASRNGHFDIVAYLVVFGANIHAADEYALQEACKMGHLRIVKYLVDHGANIHENNDETLVCASEKGHLEVVEYLLSMGCCNLKDSYRWAKYNNHIEVMKILEKYSKEDS